MTTPNGTSSNHVQAVSTRVVKSPPAGTTPPAPATAPPAPPSHTNATQRPNAQHHHGPILNGHATQKGKKKNEVQVDPVAMYESLKSRIAALEEEEVLEEEEERRFAEEAQKSVKGLEESAIQGKYIELFAELKRIERDHAKEKQKLIKDKDAAKSQLTKANQTKIKMENLARELQKDNKRLREDGKRLAQSVEEAQDELLQMKNDLAKRADKAKIQDAKYREMPDIVIKVVCRYRAELFFKISRKTKLSRLINAWTDRMEHSQITGRDSEGGAGQGANKRSAKLEATGVQLPIGLSAAAPAVHFIFTHNGRSIKADDTPEEVGLEDGDDILAVEMMDLTEPLGADEWDEQLAPRRETLKKMWTDDPREAKRTLEEIFDGVVRERLKEVFRQYELRERHFECIIRSKELEVLLSRARAAEQKQLAEGEKARVDKLDEENQQLRKELEEARNGQTILIDKLITCCKEPNVERTQRLFQSLREELEKKGSQGSIPKVTNGLVGG